MKSKLLQSTAVGLFTFTLATSLAASPSNAALRPNVSSTQTAADQHGSANAPSGLVALVQEIANVPANDVVFDSARNFLYASVGPSAGASANSILAINVDRKSVV